MADFFEFVSLVRRFVRVQAEGLKESSEVQLPGRRRARACIWGELTFLW